MEKNAKEYEEDIMGRTGEYIKMAWAKTLRM